MPGAGREARAAGCQSSRLCAQRQLVGSPSLDPRLLASMVNAGERESVLATEEAVARCRLAVLARNLRRVNGPLHGGILGADVGQTVEMCGGVHLLENARLLVRNRLLPHREGCGCEGILSERMEKRLVDPCWCTCEGGEEMKMKMLRSLGAMVVMVVRPGGEMWRGKEEENKDKMRGVVNSLSVGKAGMGPA